MDERALIEKAKRKNSQAWTQLAELYGPALYNLLARFSTAWVEADDLYQEVFLRLYHKIDSYDSSRPFRPWLMRVAVNVALNHRKKIRPYSELSGEIPQHDHFRNSCEAMDEVRSLLAVLAPDARMVFLLYHYDGYDIPEIARLISMPQSTVKSHLRRSRIKLAGLKESPDAM